MMPGIIPSLLMASADAFYNAYVDPESTTWFGTISNYYVDLYAQHSGGTAPFTYAWSADSGVTIDSPNARSTRFRSSSAPPISAQCTITDALGQQTIIVGVVNGIIGGGG